MRPELLLILGLGGVTILGFMVALNARGTRLRILSFFMAGLILLVEAFVVFQYFSCVGAARKSEELYRIEIEKQKAAAQVRAQEAPPRPEPQDTATAQDYAGQLHEISLQGTEIASGMLTADLHNAAQEWNEALARATDAQGKTEALTVQFDSLRDLNADSLESVPLISHALKKLAEAARYYVYFYKAEEGTEEVLREEMMRRNAKDARNLFQKADDLIDSTNDQ